MGGVSFEVAIGIGNLTNDVGRDFTISGSSKIRVIFINSITQFSKNILQTFSGETLGLEGKGIHGWMITFRKSDIRGTVTELCPQQFMSILQVRFFHARKYYEILINYEHLLCSCSTYDLNHLTIVVVKEGEHFCYVTSTITVSIISFKLVPYTAIKTMWKKAADQLFYFIFNKNGISPMQLPHCDFSRHVLRLLLLHMSAIFGLCYIKSAEP